MIDEEEKNNNPTLLQYNELSICAAWGLVVDLQKLFLVLFAKLSALELPKVKKKVIFPYFWLRRESQSQKLS